MTAMKSQKWVELVHAADSCMTQFQRTAENTMHAWDDRRARAERDLHDHADAETEARWNLLRHFPGSAVDRQRYVEEYEAYHCRVYGVCRGVFASLAQHQRWTGMDRHVPRCYCGAPSASPSVSGPCVFVGEAFHPQGEGYKLQWPEVED